MVVEYVSGAEGSCLSFITQTPFVLLQCRGSVIPLVFPQICIAIGLSVLAYYLNESADNPFKKMEQPVSLGILVTFLLVFKTQNAFSQFWQALSALDGVLETSRALAMTTCTMFDWEKEDAQDSPEVRAQKNSELRARVRRILRFIVLYYFVIIEYFQRTGANSQMNLNLHDELREDIRNMTGPHEFQLLYPKEPVTTKGRDSSIPHANPTQVLFFIQMAAGRVLTSGRCHPPIMNGFIMQMHNLMKEFGNMNRIDKTQFPFPYAQIVKILVIIWVFTLPFFIVDKCGPYTAVVTALAAIGFFGLDEVAEILESPFGTDPNDIDLRPHGIALMSDLEMMYNGRNDKLDSVFDDEDHPLKFSELLKGQFSMPKSPSSGSLKRVKQAFTGNFSSVQPGSSDQIGAVSA